MAYQANLRPVVEGLKAKAFFASEAVCFEVFVASRTKNGDACGNWETWVGLVARALCEVGGGCTRVNAEGYWVSPEDGLLVRETTAVLTCECTREALLGKLGRIRQVVWQYGRECDQHTVAVRINGEMFGIDPTQPY